MSNKWDENRVEVPDGSEPEGQPGCRPTIIILLIAFLLVAGLLAGSLFWFLRSDEETAPAVVEDSNPPTEEVRPEASPQHFTPPGRIVFVDPDKRLGTVTADGNDLRLLTEEGLFFEFPAWSPTGELIAAIGVDFDNSGVYVVSDEVDSSVQQLYAHREQEPIYLYWKPDGQAVSFIASHPQGLALHLAPADAGGGNRVLTAGGPTFFWDWSPGGEQVLVHTGFTASKGDDTRLAFVPLDPNLSQTEVPQSGFFQTPAISADGQYYAFGDADPLGLHWLNIWEHKSDQQVRLIFHHGVLAMAWNPIHNQLAYTSPSKPESVFYGPLQLEDLDIGDSSWLVSETVLAFFWSPDGQSIAYFTLARAEESEQAGLSGETLPVMEPKAGRASSIEKNDRMIRVRRQTERRVFLNLWVIDVAGGESVLLGTFEPTTAFISEFMPFFDQYALSHRLWSPDSSALVIPIRRNNQDEIVVVPVDGSEAVTVALGKVAFWSHQ